MEDMIITRYYSPEDKLFKYHIWAFIFYDFNDNNDAGPTVPARSPPCCPMPTTGEQQEQLCGGAGAGVNGGDWEKVSLSVRMEMMGLVENMGK